MHFPQVIHYVTLICHLNCRYNLLWYDYGIAVSRRLVTVFGSRSRVKARDPVLVMQRQLGTGSRALVSAKYITYLCSGCPLYRSRTRRSGRSSPPSVILIYYVQTTRIQLHDD